jgi:hypothetical protein
MKRMFNSLTVVLLCTAVLAQGGGLQTDSTAGGTGGQASATASNQAHDSFRVADGSVFHVVLAKTVDAKKNKVGDEVTTTIVEDLRSHGQLVVPKNSVVVGHITQIEAHSKEHPQSQVAVAFDRLVIKDGTEIPLSASIQAVAAPETAPSNDSEQSGTGYGEMGGSMGGTVAGSGGRGAPSGGGVRGTPSEVAGTAAGAASCIRSVGNKSNGPRGLSAASQGVIGIKGLSLSTQGETSQDSVISSDHQNVHLEHGTQFVLRVKAKS